MGSDITFYFSKWTFLFLSFFILSFSAGLVYFSLQFFPGAWQYSLLFSIPLLLFIYILPEYIRTLYFLVFHKPALILTKEKLIDNFKGKEYRWSEIKNINFKLNEGLKAQGGHIAVYINNSEEVIKLSDTKLRCKRSDLLETLTGFHKRYRNTRI